jgi:hypothetical protein
MAWYFRLHFSDFGSAAAVRQARSRLVERWKLQRVRRGLYHLPRPHPIVGTDRAGYHGDGASADARQPGAMDWRLRGQRAGLSQSVSAKIIILTDGAPRKVALLVGKLMPGSFRRAAPRNLLGAG